jgi:hypothetical protein
MIREHPGGEERAANREVGDFARGLHPVKGKWPLFEKSGAKTSSKLGRRRGHQHGSNLEKVFCFFFSKKKKPPFFFAKRLTHFIPRKKKARQPQGRRAKFREETPVTRQDEEPNLILKRILHGSETERLLKNLRVFVCILGF